MYIKYFVPEDGDDLAHPNVFEMNCKSSPTFGQFKTSFPFPGHYHFRFLTNINGLEVWLDVVDDNTILPTTINRDIVVKASRLSVVEQDSKQSGNNLIDFTVDSSPVKSKQNDDLLSLGTFF